MDKNLKEEKINLHSGHRERMRTAISEKGGFFGMPDHEVLEYVLSMAIPRKDTNPLAHELINYFGSFANVLDADVKDLMRVKGVGERTAVFVASYKHVLKRYKESKSSSIKTLSNSKDVREYVGERIRFLPNEECFVIFLSTNNSIIKCVQIGESGNNKVMFENRKVLEHALSLKAAGVIITHNHPSGNSQPSKEDLKMTHDLYMSLALSDIRLLDHFIYAQNSEYSFKENGKLAEYFQELKRLCLDKTDCLASNKIKFEGDDYK